jgi:hypothetical protein
LVFVKLRPGEVVKRILSGISEHALSRRQR